MPRQQFAFGAQCRAVRDVRRGGTHSQLAEAGAVAVDGVQARCIAFFALRQIAVGGREGQPLVVYPLEIADVGIGEIAHHGDLLGGQIDYGEAFALAAAADLDGQMLAARRE